VEGARNALFTIDGLDFERQVNTVTDAIPGVTLTLKKGATAPATTGAVEDLVLSTDADASRTKLQKFVDAYNGVMSLVQRQLAAFHIGHEALQLAQCVFIAGRLVGGGLGGAFCHAQSLGMIVVSRTPMAPRVVAPMPPLPQRRLPTETLPPRRTPRVQSAARQARRVPSDPHPAAGVAV